MNRTPGRRKHRLQSGVTLIELVVVIVIVAVIGSGLMVAFTQTLRDSATSRRMTQALQLAQERLELIRARKDVLGFAGFNPLVGDPCNPPPPGAQPACNGAVAAGNTITTTITFESFVYSVAATIYVNPAPLLPAPFNDGNYKAIEVRVSGGGSQLAELNTMVANY